MSTSQKQNINIMGEPKMELTIHAILMTGYVHLFYLKFKIPDLKQQVQKLPQEVMSN